AGRLGARRRDRRGGRRARPGDGVHRRTALPPLMSAILMPGAPVAEATFADLEPRIKRLVDLGHRPGLATILVGDDGASAGYIRMKQEKAVEVGMTSPHVYLPDDATQADLLRAIHDFNEDPAVD